MCGRFLSIDVEDGKDKLASFKPANTIALSEAVECYPSMQTTVMLKGRVLKAMNWGIPIATNGKVIMNARQETVAEKGFFKEDFYSHRCVVLAKAFYEWDSYKNKYEIIRTDKDLFLFAGLYKIVGGVPYYVILTQTATLSFRHIHNRLPYILEKTELDDYLQGATVGKWILPKQSIDLNWTVVGKRKDEQLHLF